MMLAELAAGLVLALGVVWFVLKPVVRPEVAGGGKGEVGSVDDAADADEDFSPRAQALRALKEIEFDRATGKLADGDYAALKARYTADAVSAFRAESGEPAAGAAASRERTAPRSPLPVAACPTHGPRPEADAEFCSECGRRLTAAPGFCSGCGAALEAGAVYCNRCGVRVAA